MLDTGRSIWSGLRDNLGVREGKKKSARVNKLETQDLLLCAVEFEEEEKEKKKSCK